MMKKVFVLALGAVLAVPAAFAATKGSWEGDAAGIDVGGSKSVTLVKEYDGDGDYYDSGAYYLAVTLKRGKSYTVYAESPSGADAIDLDVYPRDTTESEDDREIFGPSATFSGEEQAGYQVMWLDGSDWDLEEDPSSWKYYIYLSGDAGTKATVKIVEGIVTFLEEGLEENPGTLSFSDRETETTRKFTEEHTYYFTSKLTAGRKYLIRTGGGTAAQPFDLSIDPGEDVDYTVEADPAYASDTNNTAWIIYPNVGGTYTFVAGSGPQGTTFKLVSQRLPARTIANHPFEDIVVGGARTFRPGRLVADRGYYDAIPDEWLTRFKATKGARYYFEATGADRSVQMVVFDKSGNLLGSNGGIAVDSFDVRIGFTATGNDYYYVGVYDPALTITNTIVCSDVELKLVEIAATDGEAIGISPLPGKEGDRPVDAGSTNGVYSLSKDCWTKTFVIGGRKGITYSFETQYNGTQSPFTLAAEVYTLSGTFERKVTATGSIDPFGDEPLSFTATANNAYYVRVSVKEGFALDFPEFYLFALATATDGEDLGILTVNAYGTPDARWYVDRESSTLYPSGTSILIGGTHTVNFKSVTNFNPPAAIADVVVTPGTTPTVRDAFYSDKNDPADDYPSGTAMIDGKRITYKPVSWSLRNTETSFNRTLWTNDVADVFTFSGADENLYDFAIENLGGGDAHLTITNATSWGGNGGIFALDAESVQHLALPKLKTQYFLVVHHALANESPSNGYYTVSGKFAKVGAIKFSKTAVSVKKNAGSVKLTVNRTAKDGRVRVKYGTVAGTARPGERYVAQNGVLEWAANDNKAKDIVIKLIPDLVAVYAGDTTFDVRLEPYGDEGELEPGEYVAPITVDTCTVTITESASKSVDTLEKAYAKTVTKAATVKTEDVALRSGTFYGVLAEDGSALTNGLPQLASVTLTTTVKAGKSDSLSANVVLAGKTYTFKSDTKNPEEWEDLGDGRKQILLKLLQTVNKIVYTNELTLTVQDGATTNEVAWLDAGGTAELVMNVPDANNKGAQEEIHYVGDIYRQNAKIQNYLNVVTNFFGYYTVALAPEGVSAMDGIPAGNGYLTVKVDNKGKATVAGLLADNTRVSLSVTAAGICKDESSPLGYAMYLPIFVAKSPYCFGGTLRLYAKPGKTLPNKDYEIVVDSTQPLIWNNDNAKLTYYNEDGWRILCDPVGGWYDTVMNLQAYYLNYAFEVGGADITEFPTELVANGYRIVTDVQPNGESVGLVNDAFSTAKKSLIKDGSLYDLVNSVNPCNVQVKLARATGIVTGSFSIWSEDEDGLKQKEITGFNHNGVLLLSRDELSSISEDVISVGFSLKTGVKLTDENPDTGGTTTRSWNLSLPFNLLGVDQGDIDWWADDWGWNPEWGEEPAE